MKKTLVVIENDLTLDGADYVEHFMRSYQGKIIELTNFRNKTNEEIYKAVSICTDIAVQTCFVNGSDHQLYDMVGLLAKIPHPINVYIAYLGISHQNELREYLVNNLYPENLVSIEHHNIYAMSRHRYGDIADLDGCEPHLLLDFTSITKKVHKARSKKMVHNLYLENYKETARTRPTGRKVLVLGCTANGVGFKNLPIGEVVDELICDDLLTTKKPARGVWIWGNGEPIMLVNDHGFREYKITTKLDSEGILREIGKVINSSKNISKLKELKVRGLLHIIEDKEEVNIMKANLICEELKISKRGNRQLIYTLLNENLEVSA